MQKELADHFISLIIGICNLVKLALPAPRFCFSSPSHPLLEANYNTNCLLGKLALARVII